MKPDPEMIAYALKASAECLEEYRKYGEEMRKHGRGFHPTGPSGESIEAVIEHVRSTLASLTGRA